MIRRSVFAIVVSASLLLGGAKDGGHQKETKQFPAEQVRIILDYYQPSTSNLPPGLAKRGGKLPPGLEKQLRRNGQLPPGLAKRLVPFPADLERRLPPQPGCRRAVLDSWALLIHDATNVVLDIIDLTRRR
jgi:hypothetical protein